MCKWNNEFHHSKFVVDMQILKYNNMIAIYFIL